MTGLKLGPAWSLPGAVRHIVRHFLPRLEAGQRGVLATDGSRSVHGARVALRRIRSALKLLGRADETASALRRGLGRVAKALGDARDWDVLVEQRLPPIARAFGRRAAVDRIAADADRRRRGAHAAARRALASERYRALTAELARWLALPSVPAKDAGAVKKFAARRIRKRHKRLLRDCADFAWQTPVRRHRIRLEAKQLRYTVEFFESLFGRARVRPYLRELTAIQDALGAINDCRTAARLLARLHASAAFARFARERLKAYRKTHSAAAQAAFARLDGCERFWKEKS